MALAADCHAYLASLLTYEQYRRDAPCTRAVPAPLMPVMSICRACCPRPPRRRSRLWPAISMILDLIRRNRPLMLILLQSTKQITRLFREGGIYDECRK